MPTVQKVRFQNLEITLSQDGDQWLTVDVRPFKALPPVVPIPPIVPLPPVPPVAPPWTWPIPTSVGIFVHPQGTAAGTGTVSNPMSLEKALGIGGIGQQIWLRGGAYNLAQTISPRLGGTPTTPWKISAYPGEEPLLNINTGARHGILFNSAATGFLEWRGIRFTDLSTGPAVSTVFNLIKGDFGHDISFVHCQVDNCKRSGVLLNATATNFKFYGCTILNNGSDAQFDHGVYVKSLSSLLFENCFFVNNAGHQLHGYNSSPGKDEGVRGIRAIENSILTFGEPSKRFIIFADDTSYHEARDCQAIGNVCFNAFPGVDDTDKDRSTIKVVNGVNSRVEGNFIWGGDIVATGSVTRLDNLVLRDAVWPKQQIWVRPSRYDAGIFHVTVFNPAMAPTVPADLTGAPAGRYEIRAASSPQKLAGLVAYPGTGSVLLPMTGLDYAAQARSGGFNWKGAGKAMGFILRRIP